MGLATQKRKNLSISEARFITSSCAVLNTGLKPVLLFKKLMASSLLLILFLPYVLPFSPYEITKPFRGTVFSRYIFRGFGTGRS